MKILVTAIVSSVPMVKANIAAKAQMEMITSLFQNLGTTRITILKVTSCPV